jgi:hypothetical protein
MMLAWQFEPQGGRKVVAGCTGVHRHHTAGTKGTYVAASLLLITVYGRRTPELLLKCFVGCAGEWG